MEQILTSTPSGHLRIKSQANKAGKGFKDTDTAIVVDSDFEEYYALLETEYEQLLIDINDEIAKRTQKMEEMQKLLGIRVADEHNSNSRYSYK